MNNNIRLCLWCRTIQAQEGKICSNCGKSGYIRNRPKFTVGEFGNRGSGRLGVSGAYDALAWANLAMAESGAIVITVTAADGTARCHCPTEEDYQAVMAWYNGPH